MRSTKMLRQRASAQSGRCCHFFHVWLTQAMCESLESDDVIGYRVVDMRKKREKEAVHVVVSSSFKDFGLLGVVLGATSVLLLLLLVVRLVPAVNWLRLGLFPTVTRLWLWPAMTLAWVDRVPWGPWSGCAGGSGSGCRSGPSLSWAPCRVSD